MVVLAPEFLLFGVEKSRRNVEVLGHDLIILFDELLPLPPQDVIDLLGVVLQALLEGALALVASLLYLFLHLRLMLRLRRLSLLQHHF